MTQGHKKTLGLAVASLVLGCLFWFPLLGILFGLAALIMGIVALVKINKNKEQLQGEGLAIAGIVMGGLSIVMIPLVVLMAAIAIPNLLRARLYANEAAAQARIATVRTALETYAAGNVGAYPVAENELTDGDLSYLDQPCDRQTINGYTYSLQLSPDAYTIVAVPVTCGVTGNHIFQMRGPGGDVDKKPCAIAHGD